MGKRKHKSEEKDIRRKIRRLQSKLRHNKRKDGDRSSCSSTSSSRLSTYGEHFSAYDEHRGEYEDNLSPNYEAISDYEEQPQPRSTVKVVHADIVPRPPATNIAEPPCPVNLPASTVLVQTEQTEPANPIDSNQPSADVLPEEILSVLGEAKNIEQPLGESVPKEISERWGKILIEGLSKEQKVSLEEKILIPSNFLLARAPKLNPEVIAVLTETVKKRDLRLENAQNQLGRGIAGLVNLTKDLIKTDLSKLEIIKKISEASQILLNLHYEETVNRRKLIVPLLDKKFWNMIQGARRDDFLFGGKLGDNIKNAKDIERSGQQIKKLSAAQSSFQQRKQHPGTGNVRAPLRQLNVKAVPAQQPSPATKRTHHNHSQRGRRPYSNNKVNERRRR